MNDFTLCPFCFESMKTSGSCPHCGHRVGEPSQGIQQLPVGWILDGKYRIGMTLGQGGFGITYLAYDLNLQQKVAIKEYFPSGLVARNSQIVTPFTQSGQSLYLKGVDSFYREAQLLARFQNHPNNVHIHNFFRENNTAYFVMEYVKGKSLSTYLDERGGKLSFDETISLLCPIMNALDELHQSGILHRDIAPDNINLTENGTVKLLDFGAAKNELNQHTHSSAAILKPGYAPLEQYSVTGNQGPWTDVYAMGAVVYRCLSGMMPPDSPDRITGREPISSSGVKVSNQVETAVAKALSLSIPDRWQHMFDFKNALSDQNTKVSPRKSAYGNKVPVQQKSAEKKAKKNNSRIIIPSIIILSAITAWLIIAVLIPTQKYNNAINLMNEENYTKAIDVFTELGGYKDAAERIRQCEEKIRDERYEQLLSMIETGNMDETMQAFEVLSEFQNDESRFNQAIALEANTLQNMEPQKAAEIIDKTSTDNSIAILEKLDFNSIIQIAKYSSKYTKENILRANNEKVKFKTKDDENFRIMVAFSEKNNIIRFGSYEQDDDKK